MKTYRVQVRLIDIRQVEITVDSYADEQHIKRMAKREAWGEFGACDEIEVICVEDVESAESVKQQP